MSANPPDRSSLFEVSRHVAVLLLLASGRRVHDLTLLSVDEDNFQDLGDSIVFWPEFGSKTDSADQQQSGWQLSHQETEPVFDVLSWVRQLLVLSRQRRRRHRLSALFITTRGRLAPASRTVIAGWIRTALAAAGIDASPGSFRSAVGSSRLAAGCSLDDVLRRGNWRSPQTFLRHYYRPIAKGSGGRSDAADNGFSTV